MNTNAAHQIPVHRQRRRISRQEMLRRKRAIRRRKRIARFFRISVAVLLLLTAVSFWQNYGGEILPTVDADAENIIEALSELVKNNAEAADFVADYPNRQNYLGQSIDLTHDVIIGQVPLFLQWDKRWGYVSFGDSIIGLSGCGPTCLSMAYVYFTRDLNGTPREMASYCEKNGYYTESGTSWSLWTDGLSALGLSGEELSLSENSMKKALDQGKLIVCSMRPGDFTTSGHYILLFDYDDTGFCVKDPNRVSNSSHTWDYVTLSPQIKNLWAISPTGF